MNLNLFSKKKPSIRTKEVNVLSLQPDDLCYYGSYQSPFKVTDKGTTNRGVEYIEIKHLRSGKSHLFTDKYVVRIQVEEEAQDKSIG